MTRALAAYFAQRSASVVSAPPCPQDPLPVPSGGRRRTAPEARETHPAPLSQAVAAAPPAPMLGVAPRFGSWTFDDWRAAFGERAGILEFDAGMTRPEAEARALDIIAEEIAAETGHPPESARAWLQQTVERGL